MIEWALFVFWWCVAGAAAAGAVAAGGLVLGRGRVRGHAWGLLEVLQRFAAGAAALSFAAACLGLAGLMRWWALWPAALALAASGAARTPWRRIADDLAAIPGALRSAALRDGAIILPGVAALAVLAAMALNIAVGAMAPDFGQDSVWYHLSVPEQWIATGRMGMMDHCVPSTYMLAGNALHAYPLSLGTDLPASLIYAAMILCAMALFPLAGWLVGGARTAVLAAWLVPLWGVMHGMAPVGAGNDVTTALWLAMGLSMAAPAVAERRALRPREALASGFVLGTAAAAKLPAAGFAVPFVLFFGAWMLLRTEPRAAAKGLALHALAGLAALAPWLARGFLEAGNPLVIAFPGLFPIRPEFAPVLEGAAIMPHGLHPITPAGLREAAFEGLPAKFGFAVSAADALFLLLPLASAAALFARDARWRLLGAAGLGCGAIAAMVVGYNETVRFFAVSYLAMAPAAAKLLAFVAHRLRPRAFAVVALVLGAAAVWTYAPRQIRWAGYGTVGWRFQPLATQQARRDWAAGTENGHIALAMTAGDRLLPRDAVVVLPESPGPRGLRRRAIWSDYASPPLAKTVWAGLDAEGLDAWMAREGATHLLFHGPDGIDERLLELERAGRLRRVSMEPLESVILERVPAIAP